MKAPCLSGSLSETPDQSAIPFFVTVTDASSSCAAPPYKRNSYRQLAWIQAASADPEGPDAKISTLKGPDATRANMRTAMEKIAREATPTDALVLMLIGHGSYDGVEYKINLPGPDLSAAELGTLLNRVPATRQLVVNMTALRR